MRVLLVPNLPASVRALARELAPRDCTLEILTSYDAALPEAEVLMGLPRMKMDAAFLARAPKLKLIQLMRAGHELIDLPAAEAAGISVATVGDTTSGIVAEHTLMLMLALVRKLRWQHESVVTGGWLVAKPWQLPSGDVDSVPEIRFDGLAGKTLGILGYGEIGSRVGALARAFGMTVCALARGADRGDVTRLALPELLATSDIITIHLRLSLETKGLINADALARMKPGSFLINTARGEIVDEAALIDALARGHLAGAALDTLQKEPPARDNPLLARPDVLLTPHTAWLTHESWRRTLEFAFANITRFRSGQPLHSQVRSTTAR